MHYCARNLFKLRFFNIYSQVGSDGNNQVTTDFKPVLERVSKVTSADELKRIVTQFIAHTYELPENTIYFYIRNREHTNGEDSHTSDPMYDRVEQLLQSSIFYDEAVMRMLHDHKVLIQDELAFSQEYDPSHAQATLLYLCQELRASAFIPIFQYDRLVGYIMIEEYAREELFTQREQDELSMLAHYLSNIIYLLSHRDIGSVIAREKDLQAQLYRREREVEQYKESIRSCLRLSRDTDIGVMVYKHRRFHFRNKVAHEIAGVDPNTDKGHPLTHTLNDMVSKVETQQQRKVTSCQNGYHHTIMISAMHELENNGIIITLSYPDATQTLQTYLNEANDPQDWDYLVYLETTQMGRHLDRLIPGKHKQIINLKLSILHAALSKSPVLISATREDAIELVSFLHSASDRDIYHTITLDRPERSNHVSHELFGTARKSPLADPTLLEQLHEQGTLCIENAHFLSFHTQKQLAHYLHYGYFQQENSEYKLISDMRVICTTPYTTNRLLEQGMLLPSFHKHVPYTISMPNFETLSEDAFQALVDALVSQMSPHYSTQRFIACSHRDYAYLRRTCSESLHALRHGIAHLMHKKSEKHNLNTKVDAVSLPQEPTLFRAAQLGKEALKDRDLMIFLWNTFKSQQKIATLLNVNRSSVNRRIKQFNIEHESEQVS